jgi:hypothetical protein
MSYQDQGYDHGLPPTYQMATSVHYDNQKGANILLNGQYMQTNPSENTNYSVPFYVNLNQLTTGFQEGQIGQSRCAKICICFSIGFIIMIIFLFILCLNDNECYNG